MMPLDLGAIEGFSVKFSLYTVPGQVQYVNSRKAILSGVDGIVFVADSSPDRWLANTESLQDLKNNLAEYDLNLQTIPWVLQYNKRDVPGALPVAALEAELAPGPKRDVRKVVPLVLSLPRLRRHSRAPQVLSVPFGLGLRRSPRGPPRPSGSRRSGSRSRASPCTPRSSPRA